MEHNVMLTIMSLLSILFMSFHHADDVVRGMAPGKFSNLIPIFFLLVWLYGTLVLAGRRLGYVIILVASLLASGIPLVHMRGRDLSAASPSPAETSETSSSSGRSSRPA